MALLVSTVPFVVCEVDLRHKPREFVALSLKATVPILVLPNGRVIDQSLDIMRWALRQNDPEDWFAGDDAALVAIFDSGFKQHLDRYKYAKRESIEGVENRNACALMLHDLEARLTVTGNLCRDTRSFTDVAVLPFVRQFAAVDHAWFDAQPMQGVHRWLAFHLASPLFVAAMAK